MVCIQSIHLALLRLATLNSNHMLLNLEFQVEIEKLVDFLLQLNQELQTEKLPANIEQIKIRIAHSEEKIDQLVYELYQLTPEEIKMLEGGGHE